MAAALSAGEPHDSFVQWAGDRGVSIHGVTSAKFVGKGLGVVAQRHLKQGETLVYVPASALLTVDSPVVKALKLPRTCTVHGQLAAALTLIFKESGSGLDRWRATWPSSQDFENSMPLLWDDQLKQILPWRAKDLVDKQHAKLDRDLQALGDSVSHDDYEQFRYFWLIVNTRTFYWDFPTAKKRNPRNLVPDDCMALLPFADYFNHADVGCDLFTDHEGCKMVCNRDYRPEEEVYACYGNHSNDFLLAEYGFILAENQWDEVKLDSIILPKLTRAMKGELEGEGFLGDYTLDSQSICHRTQVTIRRLISRDGWLDFAAGITDGEREQHSVNAKAFKILDDYLKDIRSIKIKLQKMPASDPRDLLLRRWNQIEHIIDEWRDKNATP